ncbi:ATP-binding protein [Streptomyces sudanensis]|uniref:ATP-binding protein n=1 Tax=Streptomyces sudanensis TaxID=436397 RepID=UPI0020CEA823|nr:ATP-binding protein [Streptomyces sudanensis]MCP9956715.1 ATP-binding protein [Streptomyces sudanensis]MCQ0002686.1 ATP-binding protein [Streptomyces sudanensis]
MVAGRERGTPDAVRLRRRIEAGDLSAVAGVRCALRRLWGHRIAEEPVCTAELLTSELVTNALVHTAHGAVVTATLDGGVLRVEVRDFAPEPPAPRVPAPDGGTHGRGLLLVQALADEWGVRAQGVGKTVWFELLGVKPAA